MLCINYGQIIKKSTKQPILNEDETLSKVQNYEIYIKKGNFFDTKNY